LKLYKSKIKDYETADFRDAGVREQVANVDKKLSEMCNGISHFCYFGNGYIHYKTDIKRL